MNAAVNSGINAGLPGMNFLTGPGFLPQLIMSVIILIILHITFFGAEVIYRQYKRYDKAVTELLPLTYPSDNRSYEIGQDPNDERNDRAISLSDNERTGTELSYSFWIYVNPKTFSAGTAGLAHVFHKGYARQFPLLGPGVYMTTNYNTMRVYMNSTSDWNNYVDIENFPVQKWVCVALVIRANGLEVYINGDLSKRLTFSSGVPYMNFGNIYAFSTRQIALTCDDSTGQCAINSLKGKSFIVSGMPFSGQLSRLRHFNYALSYTEISALVKEGPNPKIVGEDENKPPYLVDTWWTTTYNQ